jgi:hypothetical protein
MKNLRENWRLIALGTAIWLLFGAFMLRLVDLQIVNGPAFLAAQQRGSSITQTIKAHAGIFWTATAIRWPITRCITISASCAHFPRGQRERDDIKAYQYPAQKRRNVAGFPARFKNRALRLHR